MKAAWITDVHLNFLEDGDTDRFLDSLSETNPDIVLFTGDVGEADTAGSFLLLCYHSPFFAFQLLLLAILHLTAKKS